MKLFDKLICTNMNNIIYKETILCLPSIILVILIVLVELMSIYEYKNIIPLLKKLIAIFTPSNFLVKSLLPGYFIDIFMKETNYIANFSTYHNVHPIIKQHANMWNNLYNFYRIYSHIFYQLLLLLLLLLFHC